MSTLHVLLPAPGRFDTLPSMQHALARGDALPRGAVGELAASSCFTWQGADLPVAALLRDHARHDAGTAAWLCADPSHVHADMTGARMLACGNLDLDVAEAAALVEAVQPLLADAGMRIEPTWPARWHLRAAEDAVRPAFDTPAAVLGDDIADHLPKGPEGRPWRKLFNEVQMVLHQHPVNRERATAGRMTANSLWFWGAGRLPESFTSPLGTLFSDADLPIAMGARAGVATHGVDAFDTSVRLRQDALLDLTRAEPETCMELVDRTLKTRCAGALVLHFADGQRWRIARWQRWRLWRRAGS